MRGRVMKTARTFGVPLSLAFVFLAALTPSRLRFPPRTGQVPLFRGTGLRTRAYETARAAASYKQALARSGESGPVEPLGPGLHDQGPGRDGLSRDGRTPKRASSRPRRSASLKGRNGRATFRVSDSRPRSKSSGFEDAALRSLVGLLDRATFKPVVPEAARRYARPQPGPARASRTKRRARALAAVVGPSRSSSTAISPAASITTFSPRRKAIAKITGGVSRRPRSPASWDCRRKRSSATTTCRSSYMPWANEGTALAGRLEGLRGSIRALDRKWGWKDALTPGWKKE